MPTETDFGRRGFNPAPERHKAADEVAAEWFQHQLVLELRREMAAGATTTKELAEMLGQSVGNLDRKLTGRKLLTYRDIVSLLLAFGPSLIPAPGAAEHLFPPSYRSLLRWHRQNGMQVPTFAAQEEGLN